MTQAFHDLFSLPAPDDASHRLAKPVLGTVKLLPLPGSIGFRRIEQIHEILSRAEQEATALASGGVHGILIENTLGQIMHGPAATGQPNEERLDAAAIVLMGQLLRRIQQLTGLPVGVSVLPNDPATALAIAAVSGGSMVRIPLATGAKVAAEGFLQGKLPAVLAYQQQLGFTQQPFYLVDLSVHHILPGDSAAMLPEALQTLDSLELTPPVSHLLRLARYIESLCPPETLAKLVFIVSDLEISPDECARLRELLETPVLAWNQKAGTTDAPAPVAMYQLASGLLLESGIRKRATSNLLPTVDMVKTETLMNHLYAVKTIEELQSTDPDFFVGQKPGIRQRTDRID